MLNNETNWENFMGKKTIRWLLAGIALVLFVVGVPLAQQVIATANASEPAKKQDVCSAHESKPMMSHPSVMMLGDNFVQVVPAGDSAIGVFLYDSSFNLIGGNQNEASLVFSLPDGTQKTVKIAVPDLAALQKKASGDACCATPGEHPNCPHAASGEQDAAAPSQN
ncbi:MAG: hypothetical protein C4520_19080 [Candidatus Abyssobacteria bacterium SURF_5]|uniref:Uncharacterized protein n=1 Tax=Abyssobacteria bacterium (strain SURF_5) TaxID=2093360 RepID=A0A3A4NGK9_ABYX5|nr:MAG: hypothetical protein C4520_19080 [Candidatus Abyssubacteria bacterium SURF_5]